MEPNGSMHGIACNAYEFGSMMIPMFFVFDYIEKDFLLGKFLNYLSRLNKRSNITANSINFLLLTEPDGTIKKRKKIQSELVMKLEFQGNSDREFH